jgi:enhancer of polycomb-like protein
VAINAATQRHSAFAQDVRSQDGENQKEKKEPYIPTPDAAGIVKDYDDYYPFNCWIPSQTHLRFADTLEDIIQLGLSNGYSYYMDERDLEWLEKNNQSANGESTSAQAIAASGLTSRSSRTSKAKGKEPDLCNALVMNEDEFELVMGLFEKETDERYPYLHVVRQAIDQLSHVDKGLHAGLLSNPPLLRL